MSLSIFAIYDHPTDYPDHFVVREYLISNDNVTPLENIYMKALTLKQIQEEFDKTIYVFCNRSANDDEKIIGIYI